MSTWTVTLLDDTEFTVDATSYYTEDDNVVFYKTADDGKGDRVALVSSRALAYAKREHDTKPDYTITIGKVNVEDVALAFAKFKQRQFVGYTDRAPSIQDVQARLQALTFTRR